jgi:tyrosine-protein phosphatase YwqE
MVGIELRTAVVVADNVVVVVVVVAAAAAAAVEQPFGVAEAHIVVEYIVDFEFPYLPFVENAFEVVENQVIAKEFALV